MFKTLSLIIVAILSVIVCFSSHTRATLYVSQFAATASMYAINEASAVPTIIPLTPGTLTNPVGVAINNNYLFMANSSSVLKIDGAGNVSTYASGFSSAYGIAFDSGNNLYIANKTGSSISRVTPGGIISTFATGIVNPQGLAFDAVGNLYVSSSTSGNIIKITPDGVISNFATLAGNSQGMAIDNLGRLYIANGNSLVRIVFSSPGTFGNSTNVGTVTSARGVTTDPVGNIFVVSQSVGFANITKFTPNGSSSTAFVPAFHMTHTPYFITQGTLLPEPNSLALLGSSVFGLLMRRRQR